MLTRTDIRRLLEQRHWSVTALAERWGLSRRHVTAMISNEERGQLWNDAFRGLPPGPGLYRKGVGATLPSAGLPIGGLVASEAEMDTFGYGSRGVVVANLSRPRRWLVVWDGGTEMEIDKACLADWVVDLGLRLVGSENWQDLELAARIDLAKKVDLYG